MKRKLFFSTIFAVLALISMAQFPQVDLAPVNLDSVTTSSAKITGLQQTGSGLWFSRADALNVLTNVWTIGNFIPHQGSYQSIEHTANSLGADSDYVFRVLSSYDSLFSIFDIDYTEIVHTKPLAHPVDLLSVASFSLLPNSGFNFNVSTIGQPAFAFGLDYVTFQKTTDTAWFGFNSNYSGTVHCLSDSPNMFHPQTRFYVRAVDGSSYDVMTVPAFTSPSNLPPVTTNATPVKTPITFHVTINVSSLGNGGNPTFAATITDTAGPVVYQKNLLLTATGVINIDTVLVSNHRYHFNAITTSPNGLVSTISFSFQMPNVASPSVVGGSGTFGLTNLTGMGYVNRNGTSDSSGLRIAYLLRSGVPVDSIVTPTSDTLVFSELNQPLNTNYSATIKVINKANLSATSTPFNVHTTPVLEPSFTNNTPVKTPGFLFVGFSVTSLGNTGNPQFYASVTDSITHALVWDTLVTVTATGPLNIATTNVTSNHWYLIKATLYGSLSVGDSISLTAKTPNVSGATTTPTVTTNYTDYIVSAPVTQNGTYDSSAIKKVRLSEDGVWIDSLLGNISLATFHIYQRIPGATYHGKVEVTNMANLVYTTNQFNIVMNNVSPNGAPTFLSLVAVDASTLTIMNIVYHATGSPSNVRILCEDLTLFGYADTFTVVTGVTGNGTVSSFTLDHLIGNHTYRITIFDESQYGAIVWGYYDTQGMPEPESSGVLSAVLVDSMALSSTTAGVEAFGSREGNDCILKFHWFNPSNVEMGVPFPYTNLPGLFNQKDARSGLMPSTTYTVITELIAIGNVTVTRTDHVTTLPATGIEEIQLSVNTIKSTQMIRLWNLLDQEIGYGEFQNVLPLAKQSGSRFVLAELYDEQGKPQGHGKLPLF